MIDAQDNGNCQCQLTEAMNGASVVVVVVLAVAQLTH